MQDLAGKRIATEAVNLTREYLHLHRAFGWDERALAGLARNGLRHAFLSDVEREVLEGRFRDELALLGLAPEESTSEPEG